MPNGYRLDGKGFTITAVDGDSFNGAVVQNDDATMNSRRPAGSSQPGQG